MNSYLQSHQHLDILVFSKRSYYETFAKHPVHESDFVLLYIHRARREYNVIVRDSEPIRLLESPRSMSVYILNIFIFIFIFIFIIIFILYLKAAFLCKKSVFLQKIFLEESCLLFYT